MPLLSTSMSSPAVRLVAVMPFVPPVKLMSRVADAVPSVMLLLASPLVSTRISSPADTVSTFTVRAPTTTLLPLLLSASTSTLSAMTQSRPPAFATPPVSAPLIMMRVVPPEARLTKSALPVPLTLIMLPAVTVPSTALLPKFTPTSVPALVLPSVMLSALTVTDPNAAVLFVRLAALPPSTRIEPLSAIRLLAMVPFVVVILTSSNACAVPSIAWVALMVILLGSPP